MFIGSPLAQPPLSKLPPYVWKDLQHRGQHWHLAAMSQVTSLYIVSQVSSRSGAILGRFVSVHDLISGKGWLILLAIPYFPFVPKSQKTTESRHPWNDQINNLQPLNSPKFWTRPFKRVASSGLSHFRTPPCILGCSIPNTKMEFGRGWSRTGCRLTPLVSIQNPDPEKFQEVSERTCKF